MPGIPSICETPVALTKLYYQCFGNETLQQCRLFYTHQCWLTYKNNSATLGHSFTYSCSLIQPKSVYYTVKMVQSLPHGGSKDFQAFGFGPVFVWLTVYPGCIRRTGTGLQPNSSCLLMKAAQWCMQQKFFFFLSTLPP